MLGYQVDIIIILFAHFVADFIGQSDWMATNKSKSNAALLAHGAAYFVIMSVVLGSGFQYVNSQGYGSGILLFVFVNTIIHILIDYFTSRATSYLWKEKEVHWFFVVVGFDQFLHAAVLISTMFLL